MYTHLLVPTDGSELSTKALTQAINFAKSLGAKITFLYVQPEFPLLIAGEGALLLPENREEFARDTAAQAEQILSEARSRAAAQGVEASSCTAVSDVPYQVIINTADAEGCDLVFMASHARKGLVGIILGSETKKVLSHSKIPVLVYR
ncbi:MAG: sulfate transporter [Candidatus Dactylopiibacterium carminicum]|uniref:Sulfate transporter n=1 Tax=Candidatus Dactylopiibacterium carminicum TaxID=857335 RepID=A0A272ENM6_9RHOO|nr:universal stress protein [Candidatus Dactylopiibacterium carminicum]KAF7599117.1 universal stress protein [Candidatus Dactylopiibacterium carminicum]PAS91703.1 MAG: sulfate transporter [Candidatus Dactylopiibacterium carminicum]PAS99131.1 MAG: sulfate transporter [Candidatus Dactylopiibacterium carminicum]